MPCADSVLTKYCPRSRVWGATPPVKPPPLKTSPMHVCFMYDNKDGDDDDDDDDDDEMNPASSAAAEKWFHGQRRPICWM